MDWLRKHGVDLLHLLFVCLAWPLGTGGLYLGYAVTYCLSKREGSHALWAYVNVVLLTIALHYNEATPYYRAVFWLRDVALLSLIHYRWVTESGSVKNTSGKGRALLWTFSLAALILKRGGVHNLLQLLLDMIHGNLQGFFNLRHGTKQSIVLYYSVVVAKAVLFSVHSSASPLLQCLILLQLDVMSYASPPNSIHAVSFKVLATTQLMSSFFM